MIKGITGRGLIAHSSTLQILGLRSSVVETPGGPGDGEDASVGDGEEEDDDDDGEVEEDPTKPK